MIKGKQEEEAEGAGHGCLGVQKKKKKSPYGSVAALRGDKKVGFICSKKDLDQTFHTL